MIITKFLNVTAQKCYTYCIQKQATDHVLFPVQCLFLQKMTDFKEQCICIKLFQIGKVGAQTFQMLTFAFREEAMMQSVVFDSSAESRNGMTSLKEAEYSGFLPTGRIYRNVEHLRDLA